MSNKNEDNGHSHDIVEIIVNSVTYKIHRGHQTVAEIKTVASIPAAYELEMVVDGKFTPLPDDGAVTIKGGEKFNGHPKDSSSS